MKKKKWLYLIGFFVIVVPVLFLYFSFNGNPISKWQAKKVTKNYLAAYFLDGNYALTTNGAYNFKDSSYFFDYMYTQDDLSWEAKVEVGNGIWPSEVMNHYLHYNFTDYEMNERLSMEGSKYVEQLFADIANYVNYEVQVPNNTLAPDTVWAPSIAFALKPHLYIEIPHEHLTKDQFLKSAQNVQNILKSEGIDYEWVRFYTVKNELEGAATIYEIYFKPGENLTGKQVMEY